MEELDEQRLHGLGDPDDGDVPKARPTWRTRIYQCWISPYSRIVYFGVLFAAIFLSASLIWNFTTTLLEGRGFVMLAINYSFISLSSLFSVLAIEAFGLRPCSIFSVVSIAIALACCVFGQAWLILAQAPLLGFASSLLYNTQSSYTSRLGDKEKLGMMLGLFWTIANGGTVISNFLTGYLSSLGFQLRTIFLCGLAWMVVPFIMAIFLPTVHVVAPVAPKESPAPPESPYPDRDSSTTPSVGGGGGRNDAGLPQTEGCRVKCSRVADKQGRRVATIFALLRNPDCLLVVPMMFIMGTFTPFYASKINPVLGPNVAGIAWTIQTLTRTILTFPFGWLADRANKPLFTVLSWLGFVGVNVMVWFFETVKRPWFYYCAYALLAVTDTINWSTLLSPTLARDFDDIEAVFSLYRALWPIAQLICLVIAPYVSVRAFDVGHTVAFTICFSFFLAFYIRRSARARHRIPTPTKPYAKLDSIAALELESVATADDQPHSQMRTDTQTPAPSPPPQHHEQVEEFK